MLQKELQKWSLDYKVKQTEITHLSKANVHFSRVDIANESIQGSIGEEVTPKTTISRCLKINFEMKIVGDFSHNFQLDAACEYSIFYRSERRVVKATSLDKHDDVSRSKQRLDVSSKKVV